MLSLVAYPRWQRLADAMEEERVRQRFSWAELARRAKVSERTIYDMRHAAQDAYSPQTLDRLERALWWTHGSLDRVLDGKAPQRERDPDLARIHLAWRDLSPDARRALAEVAERLAT
jgi:transcriptional regulator with XRE-family HTH domain